VYCYCIASEAIIHCLDIEKATGIPQVQQVVKLEDGREVTKKLDSHFVHDWKLKRDVQLFVYNRGRYEMSVLERFDPASVRIFLDSFYFFRF
jgi:hypothetical protein